MLFGIAKDIITPTAPIKLACTGMFEKNFAGIHDDIYVRCLILGDGKQNAVLMSLDLLFHDRLLNEQIAAYAREAYGIPPEAVIVSYTHAHTAPATRGYNMGHHDNHYEEMLLARARACIDRAMCSRMEGTLEYTCFQADFNVSRRGNVDGVFDNIPDFSYPRDREFWVLCLRDSAGNIRSVVANFACHPVFYPARDTLCSEFPGRLCQLLDAQYYGCVSLFFQSAAGDVRPGPTVDPETLQGGVPGWRWNTSFADVDAFAKMLFSAVCEAINGHTSPVEKLSLASDSFTIELPMDGQPLSYFLEKKEIYKDYEGLPDKVNASYILNGGYDKLADALLLHCQTLRLSENLYIAALGGEPCFGVKEAVKGAFPGKGLCFIGYTDACAYLVDDRILSEGGYEPACHLEYCLKGPFLPGLDGRYTAAFSASVRRLEE